MLETSAAVSVCFVQFISTGVVHMGRASINKHSKKYRAWAAYLEHDHPRCPASDCHTVTLVLLSVKHSKFAVQSSQRG